MPAASQAALEIEPGSAALEQWVRKCDAELADASGAAPVRE